MIFGQSAGGESVLIHLASPNAYSASYFQSAIVESGPIALNFKYPDAALLLAEVFAWKVGCGIDDFACMQNKTTAEVLDAGSSSIIIPLDISEAVMQWAPVVTSDVNLPMQSLEAFESGELVKVPMMIGSNLQDGNLFGFAIAGGKPLPWWEYEAIVAGVFLYDADTVLQYYPSNQTGADNVIVLSDMLNE
jgi:para-nitrobenzyl esterase